jgi:hypothetical protein
MGDYDKAKCKSCKAEIHFYATTKGHKMPLDAKPVAGGNLQIKMVDRGPGRAAEPVAHVVGKGNGDRVSHFLTCPDAAAHRVKR